MEGVLVHDRFIMVPGGARRNMFEMNKNWRMWELQEIRVIT